MVREDNWLSNFESIWCEQCETTLTIRKRFGEEAALDYLVGEKLLSYFSTARKNPAFAAQLPTFVGKVREIFPREPMATYLTRLEQRLIEDSHYVDQENTRLGSDAIDDLTSLRQIVDLLLADTLGTA